VPQESQWDDWMELLFLLVVIAALAILKRRWLAGNAY
jgi:hypothetical protein